MVSLVGRRRRERKGERERERVDTDVSLSGGSVGVLAACTSRYGRGNKVAVLLRSEFLCISISGTLNAQLFDNLAKVVRASITFEMIKQ